MGSHKRKKYESESSSSDSESNSSDDTTNKKKKHMKKSKYSSSDESEDEKYSKAKRGRSSDSDTGDRRHKSQKPKSEERTFDRKHKDKSRYEKEVDTDRQAGNSRHKSPPRDKARFGGKSGEKDVDEFRSRKSHDRDRYDDRERNRKDFSKERQDDRYRHKREEYRRDDRKSFRDNREFKEDNDYRNRDRRNNNRRGNRRRSNSFDHTNAKWGKVENEKSEKKEPQQKEKPNFSLSGKLTEETNTYKGIVIKYSEPPEARKPRRRWRLYPFKGEKALQTLYIHRESAYLIGRERKVVDLPVDHPSCSKQHAALQYRLVPFTRDDGSTGKRVRPYLIDLESANGTFINNKKIEAKKYYELFEKDVIKFGFSSREYVLLHENSKDEAMDDDVKQEEEELPIKTEPT